MRYGLEIFIQVPGYSVLAIEKNCMIIAEMSWAASFLSGFFDK